MESLHSVKFLTITLAAVACVFSLFHLPFFHAWDRTRHRRRLPRGLEKTLWDAANQLWAGAALKPSEYSPTVLGLIYEYFLGKFAMSEGPEGDPCPRALRGPAANSSGGNGECCLIFGLRDSHFRDIWIP